ncbi:MAG: hypothetical protein WA051_01960 [Minisyncoccia bacterium]
MINQSRGSARTLVIIIVVLIIIAGIWYYTKKPQSVQPTTDNTAAAAMIDTQSIEKDLNSIDTTGGDSVKAIDTATKNN